MYTQALHIPIGQDEIDSGSPLGARKGQEMPERFKRAHIHNPGFHQLGLNEAHDESGQNIGHLNTNRVSRAPKRQVGLLLKYVVSMGKGYMRS